jgi:hypothetical protein
MSYSTVKGGLVVRLQTLVAGNPGLTVLKYEPTVPVPPTISVLLDSYVRHQNGQQTAMIYTFRCRLYLQWQEFEQAELQLDPFVNAIAACIDQDPQLGGVLSQGIARVVNAKAQWVEVGSTVFRILDTFVEATEKGAFQSGI